jgi:hypothetical protein
MGFLWDRIFPPVPGGNGFFMGPEVLGFSGYGTGNE